MSATLPSIALSQIQFEDVTDGSGVEYVGESYGASWGDVNGDRLPDLFVSHHRYLPGLFVNRGNGTFENREFEIDVWQTEPRSDIHGGTWADFDNDGDADLMITAGSKNFTQFLVNNGTFLSDQITNFSFDRKEWGGRIPIWFDYNFDGVLDLAIGAQGEKVQLHEQVNGDFERRNSVSGHECVNNDYAHFADLTMDGRLDWFCVERDLPQRIYDYTVGVPFLDRSAIAEPATATVDSVAADIDGDLLTDFVALRGRARISGAEIITPTSIEAQLNVDNGIESGASFQTSGDLSIELHWSGPNVNQVYIGAGGVHPPFADPGEPIRIFLSPGDPEVAGIQTHDPATDRGIFIGYDPATQTWQYVNSSGSGSFSSTYTYIDSTQPISNLDVSGLQAIDSPLPPALLKLNTSTGVFTNQVASSGLNTPLPCVSVVAADFDNDMDMDLYMVCRNAVTNAANRLYENNGSGVFTLVSGANAAAGPTGAGVGLAESVVAADYDVDGFVDLFVTNGLKLYPELIGYSAGGPDRLFRNAGNGNHWVEFDLTGTTSNRDGLGAIVTVTAGGVMQRRERDGGYHRWAQNDRRIHFGLAGNDTVDVTVQWPSGLFDSYTDLPADALYEIVEGDAAATPVTVPSSIPPSVCAETAGEPDYDADLEDGLFIWKDDCGSSQWRVRVTGGTVPTSVFTGRVTSDQPYVSVDAQGLEPSDTLDISSDMRRIDFDLAVSSGRIDGFDFIVAPDASVCFGVNASVATATAGSMRTAIGLPFDLTTLQSCEGEVPIVSITDITASEDDPSGTAAVTVSLSATSDQVVSVGFDTGDGSAVAPQDYIARSGTVTFAPGETMQTVEIDLVDDDLAEPDESFTVILSDPVNALGGDLTGTVTIVDDDPPVCGIPAYDKAAEQAVFIWQDCIERKWSVRVTAGGQTATFVGRLVSTETFSSVDPFSIEGNDNLDFTTNNKEIGFSLNVGNAGQDGFDFAIPAAASVCYELFGPNAPSLVGEGRNPVTPPVELTTLMPCATGSVEADLVTTKSLASGSSSPAEGEVVTFAIQVFNNGPSAATGVSLTDDLPVGLTPTANNGNATQGSYADGLWSIGDLPNGANAVLTLEGTVEAGQAGNTLTNQTSAAAGTENDPTTAQDDLNESVVVAGGPSVSFSIGDAAGPEDGGELVFVASLAGGTLATDVDFEVSTADGTAIAGDDYTALVAEPFTIPAGATSIEIPVIVGIDTDAEADETFTLTAANVTGDVSVTRSTGTGTIEDDDSTPPAEMPLTDWLAATGGVSTSGNVVSYDGSGSGWNGTVVSAVLSSLGYIDAYEVRWTLDTDPSGTTWVVGLGVEETGSNWRDVDYALRSSGGNLGVYENGTWQTSGPTLAQGDVISIYVNTTGNIEYRLNGVTIETSTYTGTPEFYVDTSFKDGAVSLSVTVAGEPDPVVPPTVTPITQWTNLTGGVTANGATVSYSGTPTGWVNSLNSVPLSTLGAGSDFTVNWTVDTAPASTIWIAGLGVNETDANWRDVDYGFRSSNGTLTVYESGNWRAANGDLKVGDVFSIQVSGTTLEYRLNNAPIYATTIQGTESFYLDTSFKSGAINLRDFELITP